MLNFLIAPDFPPQKFLGWHLFNTNLQRHIGQPVHLLTPTDFNEQKDWVENKTVDLIYANPFDAADLVRNRGYIPLVYPVDNYDEVVIATHLNSPYQHSDELPAHCKIIATQNYDVRLISLRLLESANLNEENIQWVASSSYAAAARQLINQEGDAALFLASAFKHFNQMTTAQMRVLMESRLNELSHVVLLHPKHIEMKEKIQTTLIAMKDDFVDKMALDDLGMSKGFTELNHEDVEFMIDLIHTFED